jgi:hypothetical protein
MSNIASFRILTLVAVFLALAGAPQSSLAQRGGFHGGGGGFHGGGSSGFHGGGGFHGGSSGFRGGSGFSNFRGGNFGGFHGGRGFNGFRGGRGFNGFRGGRFHGGFRGYRGYYPGFYSGFSFGFGFWPYWGGYPYWYGYSPWWAPGPYAYYSPYDHGDYPDGYSEPGCCDRGCRDAGSRDRGYGDEHGCAPDNRDRRDNRDCYDYRQNCAPTKPSSDAAPETSPAGTYLTVNHTTCGDGRYCGAKLGTAFVKRDGLGRSDANVSDLPDASSSEANASEFPDKDTIGLRPGVRNAIAALRAMPPAARDRQLNSGRYASFSPEERELLTNKSQSSSAETVN